MNPEEILLFALSRCKNVFLITETKESEISKRTITVTVAIVRGERPTSNDALFHVKETCDKTHVKITMDILMEKLLNKVIIYAFEAAVKYKETNNNAGA